jgi:ADP-L-glycero-D-manno-heptose 6-epimerase
MKHESGKQGVGRANAKAGRAGVKGLAGDGPLVVTGGAGFVGANLAATLQLMFPGRELLVIDDLRASSYANLVEACERIEGAPYRGAFECDSVGDVRWAKLIKRLSPSAIFHLGAITDTTVMDERAMLAANVNGAYGGFGEMVRACVERGVALVYASSAATYGAPPEAARREPFAVESAGQPSNVYGFSKWLMENEHRRAVRRVLGTPLDGWDGSRVAGASGSVEDAHVVGLRYFNVFGPGESRKGKMASVAYQLAGQMLAGNNPRIFEHGEQARDQVPVEDVVDCTIAAAKPGVRGGVYNLGSGRVTTFNDVARCVREGLGFSEDERPIEYFPMPEHVRAFYQDFTQADMSKTADGLGWSPERDPLESLRAYGAFLRAEHERAGSASTAGAGTGAGA